MKRVTVDILSDHTRIVWATEICDGCDAEAEEPAPTESVIFCPTNWEQVSDGGILRSFCPACVAEARGSAVVEAARAVVEGLKGEVK